MSDVEDTPQSVHEEQEHEESEVEEVQTGGYSALPKDVWLVQKMYTHLQLLMIN